MQIHVSSQSSRMHVKREERGNRQTKTVLERIVIKAPFSAKRGFLNIYMYMCSRRWMKIEREKRELAEERVCSGHRDVAASPDLARVRLGQLSREISSFFRKSSEIIRSKLILFGPNITRRVAISTCNFVESQVYQLIQCHQSLLRNQYEVKL